MTFTSPLFFLFLPLVFLVFRAVPGRLRWLVLLVASYGFYAAFQSPSLLLSLGSVSLVGYAGGRWLGKTKERRGAVLTLCVTACLGILFVTKYLPHFPLIRHYGL